MKLASTLGLSVIILGISGSLFGCTAESSPEPEGPAALTGQELSGNWISSACEAYPNGQGGYNYLTRDFTLTDKSWTLDLDLFGDEACSYPLFSAHIEGPYTLGGLSEKVEGATEGQFGIVKNDWTAHDASMAEVFGQAGCGTGTWEVGEAQDVTKTGCIGVAHVVEECPEEFDIVAVEGDKLFFGERITDMCSEAGRPAALAAFAVVKN